MVDMSNVHPVIHGEFEDDEWRAAVSKKAPQRNRREAQIVRRGPRSHPYSDASVYVDNSVPNTVRYFQDEDHHKVYTKKHEAKGAPTAAAQPSPKQADIDAAGNAQVAERMAQQTAGRAKGA